MEGTEKGNNQISKKRRFWDVHIQTWHKSGLSQGEYCRQNQLSSSQLSYWKKKSGMGVPAVPNFVPVPIEVPELDSNSCADSGLAIILGGNIHIRLENNFSPTVLSKVIAVLGGQS